MSYGSSINKSAGPAHYVCFGDNISSVAGEFVRAYQIPIPTCLAGYNFTPGLRFDRREIDTRSTDMTQEHVQVLRTYRADLSYYVGHCRLNEMILTDRG